MKKLLALALLCACAHAENIPSQECSYFSPTTGTCVNGEVNLYFSSLESRLNVEGVDYTGPAFPASRAYNATQFYADDGSLVLLTATLVYHQKLVNSGRAHYYKHWWTIEGWSVVTP